MGFWDKRINNKNRNDIAKDMNVEESKIIELEKGKREIGGKTMDKVLGSIEENKIKSAIKNAEVLNWYYSTNLKKLRKSFGYQTQKDLAKVLGCNNSVICNLETKKIHKLTPTMLRLYDFYQNDFNKNVEVPHNEEVIKSRKFGNTTQEEFEKIKKFFETFDLKKFMDQNDLNKSDIVFKLGYKSCGGQQTRAIDGIMRGNIGNENATFTVRLYNYIQENYYKPYTAEEVQETIQEVESPSEEVQEVQKEIEEVLNNDINDTITVNWNGFDPSEMSMYEEVLEPEREISQREQKIKNLNFIIDYYKEENRKLKIQVERYEKLIDRM